MAINIDYRTKLVEITTPTTSVTIQELVDFIRTWEASDIGILFIKIIDAVGKADLGEGVETGITMTLNSQWQIQYWNGVGRGAVVGGNVVGGVGDEPIKNTGGNDTILQLGAVATTLASQDDMRKMLENKVVKVGEVITIYEADGITPWRQYDLTDGGRLPL